MYACFTSRRDGELEKGLLHDYSSSSLSGKHTHSLAIEKKIKESGVSQIFSLADKLYAAWLIPTNFCLFILVNVQHLVLKTQRKGAVGKEKSHDGTGSWCGG